MNYAILSSKQSFLFTHAAPYDVELAVITAWNLYQIRHQKKIIIEIIIMIKIAIKTKGIFFNSSNAI